MHTVPGDFYLINLWVSMPKTELFLTVTSPMPPLGVTGCIFFVKIGTVAMETIKLFVAVYVRVAMFTV